MSTPSSTLVAVLTPRGVRMIAVGDRAELLVELADLSELTDAALRERLAPCASPRRLVAVTPIGMTAERPIPMDAKSFGSAKEEIRLTLSDILPMSGDEALLGYLQHAEGGGDATTTGTLIAVLRGPIEAALSRLEGALDAPFAGVYAPEMVLPAIGLQGAAEASVDLVGPSQIARRASLRYGALTAILAPNDTAADVTLTGDAESSMRLAKACANLARVAPPPIVPLRGSTITPAAQARLPIAAIAAAVLLLVCAWFVMHSRTERATDRLLAEQASLSADVARVQQKRQELARLSALIDGAAPHIEGESQSVLPILAEIQSVLGSTDSLSRLVLTERSVLISGLSGVSGGPAAILAGVEGLSRFEAARFTAAPRPLGGDSPYEAFTLEATRTDVPKESP